MSKEELGDLVERLPAICKGCRLKSEARPFGDTPKGWKRDYAERVGQPAQGHYWCPRCAHLADRPKVGRVYLPVTPDIWVQLLLPVVLTDEEWGKMMTLLDAMKPGLIWREP